MIAEDHYGSPTNANDLAHFILKLIRTSEYGTYHATNKGSCSRYEFAKKEIASLAGLDVTIQKKYRTNNRIFLLSVRLMQY